MTSEQERRHCPNCNSQRKGEACWKCGSATIVPTAEWEYPELPSVEKIRELAKEVGYAIAVHGSLERDLDIIAAPWTDAAIGNHDLLQHIAQGMNARVVDIERKPLGRYAATIQIDGWFKLIDISVCPMLRDD